MSLVNVLGAEANPKGRHVQCKFPSGDENAVCFFESLSIWSCQYPRVRSNLVKNLAFDNLANMSSGLHHLNPVKITISSSTDRTTGSSSSTSRNSNRCSINFHHYLDI